jgi:phosphate transport system permease protein
MAIVGIAPPSLYVARAGDVRRRIVDRVAAGVITGAALGCVAVLLLILGYVAWRGLSALNLDFFTERPLPAGEVGGGVAPAILGTLTMVTVAAAIGIPIGIGTAIYLAEFGRGQFARTVRFAVDLLVGLPSIVVGVFVWVLLVRNVVGNYSGLAGAAALALIMIPIVTRTVEEILRLVPNNLREASLALGVPRWRTILWVVLPTARAGVITGTMLSVAWAGGETAPLLLTALGNQFFNWNLMEPMGALPLRIYTYALSPYDDWHTKAWGGALTLILVIGCLSVITRVVAGRART